MINKHKEKRGISYHTEPRLCSVLKCRFTKSAREVQDVAFDTMTTTDDLHHGFCVLKVEVRTHMPDWPVVHAFNIPKGEELNNQTFTRHSRLAS